MSTSIVFIDLSKAFDNVRHDKLSIKLQKLGWAALCWNGSTTSYATECRKLLLEVTVLLHSIAPSVFLKEVFSVLFCSTSTCLICTVWQSRSSLRSFADDMTLYHSDTSAEQASKTVCAALNIISPLTSRNLPLYPFVRRPRKAIIHTKYTSSGHLTTGSHT